jgi:hypothetical protein
MAISVNHIPACGATGNPFVLSFGNSGSADEAILIEATSLHTGLPLLSESYVAPKNSALHVDLSAALQLAVEAPELPDESDDTSDVAGGYGTLPGVRLTVRQGGAALHTSTPQALYGSFPCGELLRRGLTSEALVAEKVVAQQSDPGKVNPAPFFSVRSRRYAVNLYEGELMPLFFMAREDCTVRVLNSSGVEVCYRQLPAHAYGAYDGAPLQVRYLDLSPLVTEAQKYFKVILGGSAAQAVHVALSPNPVGRFLHEVVFLSSLGFYEKLLLTGSAVRTRRFEASGDEGDAPTRQALIPELQLYRKVGVRREVQESITLTAGYATPDRLQVIADMANSERIYLDGEAAICTSSELVTHADSDSTEPREVELTFLIKN